MSAYTFKYEGKEITLKPEDCTSFYNDDMKPVEGVNAEEVLSMFSEAIDITVTTEYYKDPCEKCPPVERSKKEMIPYYEMHLFLFTKKQRPVITNVTPAYENLSFSGLLEDKRVDDSYVVSLIVCPVCGKFQVQIDQVDM